MEKQHDRIERKVAKLQKYETFLKDVQQAYQDEFTDLQEINTRYMRQADTNQFLTQRHLNSGGEMDNIIENMEKFKK